MKRQQVERGVAREIGEAASSVSKGLDRAHDGLGRVVRSLERRIKSGAEHSKIFESFARLGRVFAEHLRFEEEELFPNLLIVTGHQARTAIDILLAEHIELMKRLEALRAVIGAGKDPAEAFTNFRKLLSVHQAREMSLVYPLSDMLLPPSLRKLIVEHLPVPEEARRRNTP